MFTNLTGQQKLRLMNACVHFIYNLNRDEHVAHRYGALGWLSADDRRSYLIYYFLFSIIRSSTPSYLASNFRPYTSSCDCACTSPPDLVIPSCRTSTYQRSFHYVGTTMWNSLPVNIKSADSLNAFKHLLLHHLRLQANEQAQRQAPLCCLLSLFTSLH